MISPSQMQTLNGVIYGIYFFISLFQRDNTFVCASSAKYRVCVETNYEKTSKESYYCAILTSDKSSQVECSFAIDRFNCLSQLMEDEADFARFKAEDLLLSEKFGKKDKLLVTNELRLSLKDEYEFDMVVLVNNLSNITSIADLRGKKLCHPGFDENGSLDDWSEVISQYFEEKVVPEYCNDKLSASENRLKSLRQFFGESCKPGAWSPDPVLDTELKAKYYSLCSNCDTPYKCSQTDKYWGRQGTLYCLADCIGDVTWARLEDVNAHFRNFDGNDNPVTTISCHDVSFLCQDGSKQPLNVSKPCVWLSKPWPVIAARKPVAQYISKLMDYIVGSDRTYQFETWEWALRNLLNYPLQVNSKPFALITPNKYLEKVQGFVEANTVKRCRENGNYRQIKLCVNSQAELEKCQRMSEAAKVFSMDPDMSCVLSSDCVQSVTSKQSDVMVVPTDHLVSTFAKSNKLKSILFQSVNDHTRLRYSSAVVLDKSRMFSLSDLKGKKVCFANTEGLGWYSLILALEDANLLPKICPYAAAIQQFFGSVCSVADSSSYIPSCYPDGERPMLASSSSIYSDNQALECLVSGGGDVAIVDDSAIRNYNTQTSESISADIEEYYIQSNRSHINAYDFRRVCPYENVTTSQCYLSYAAYGQVLINKEISEEREKDITSSFLLLSLLFGDTHVQLTQKSRGHSRTFKMFAPPSQNLPSNVIFEDMATHLELPSKFYLNAFMKREGSNFERRVEHFHECRTVLKSNSRVGVQMSTNLIAIWIASWLIFPLILTGT